MNENQVFEPYKNMPKISSVFTGLLLLAAAAAAQDLIKTKDQEYRGKVKSANSQNVTIELPGQGTIAVPRAMIAQIKVEPPASVLRGIEAYEKGNYREAQAALAPVLSQYAGLDTPWAAKGIDYYARCCLLAGDFARAEKGFTAFLAAYDDDHPLAMDAEIGLAETEVARQHIDKALPKFQELAAEFEKQLKPPKEQVPFASATFLGLGKCLEAKNDLAGALDAYLKVMALYPAENVMPETLYRTAALYQRQGKAAKAAPYLNDLAARFPASPYAQKARELKK